jgi:hypothetical protein
VHNDDTDLASDGPLPDLAALPPQNGTSILTTAMASPPLDSRFNYIRNERFQDLSRLVPFHLAEPLNKAKNLKDLISKFLLPRQKGRITDFCVLWQKEQMEQPPPDAKEGYQYFRVSFTGLGLGLGIIFEGIRLVCVPPEKAKGGKKMCVFGCEKSGNHCWISHSMYHLVPLTG